MIVLVAAVALVLGMVAGKLFPSTQADPTEQSLTSGTLWTSYLA